MNYIPYYLADILILQTSQTSAVTIHRRHDNNNQSTRQDDIRRCRVFGSLWLLEPMRSLVDSLFLPVAVVTNHQKKIPKAAAGSDRLDDNAAATSTSLFITVMWHSYLYMLSICFHRRGRACDTFWLQSPDTCSSSQQQIRDFGCWDFVHRICDGSFDALES